jgi:multidrug efflux pump
MALGVVPLMMASGAGAAARQAMGLVIFTGLVVGTVFTLFVVPMFYTLISAKTVKPLVSVPTEEELKAEVQSAHH